MESRVFLQLWWRCLLQNAIILQTLTVKGKKRCQNLHKLYTEQSINFLFFLVKILPFIFNDALSFPALMATKITKAPCYSNYWMGYHWKNSIQDSTHCNRFLTIKFHPELIALWINHWPSTWEKTKSHLC